MSSKSELAKQRAKRLLKHYFNMVGADIELSADYDCQVEIENIVDYIIEAAVEQVIETINQGIEYKTNFIEEK